MAAYTTREDAEKYAAVTRERSVTLSPSRPVADPPYGAAYMHRVEDESAASYRDRVRAALLGPTRTAPVPTDLARLAAEKAKARAARFESQLPGLLDEAPRGARDGFGRRQGSGWDAWLRALADVRERVVCGDIRAQHASTMLVAAYARWHVIMGTKRDACDAPVVDGAGMVIP